MALLGANDLKQFAVPTGVDAGYLSKFMLADGVNLDEILNLLAAGIVQSNTEMLNNPVYGGMFSVTDELFIEYPNGETNGMVERTEYSQPDSRRVEMVGHTLPLKGYARDLKWTVESLPRMRSKQVIANVANMLQDTRSELQKRLLTRFFTSTNTLIGSAGYNVAFANASADITYVPPQSPAGKLFASTHTHFDRKTDDATGRKAALDDGVFHLWEHGIESPYIALIPEVDIAAWSAITGIIKPDYGVRYQRTDSGVLTGVADIPASYLFMYQSDYGPVFITSSPRIPTDYFGLYKSYGMNDPRNSLAVRYDPFYGFGARLATPEIMHALPLAGALVKMDFGVGVGEGRLNGYACYFASSGNYTSPTIS